MGYATITGTTCTPAASQACLTWDEWISHAHDFVALAGATINSETGVCSSLGADGQVSGNQSTCPEGTERNAEGKCRAIPVTCSPGQGKARMARDPSKLNNRCKNCPP